jgi:hypothetical protein
VAGGPAGASAATGAGAPAGGENESGARAGAAARSPRAIRRARVRQRHLRRTVQRLAGCLDELPAAERRVLVLRAGIGGRARTRRAVARTLHRSSRRIRRVERRGVGRLRTEARLTGCAGGTGASDASAYAVAAGGAGTAGTPGHLSPARPKPGDRGEVLSQRASQGSAFGKDPAGPFGQDAGDPAPSTIAGIIFLGLIGLFVALVVIAVRRRPEPRAR